MNEMKNDPIPAAPAEVDQQTAEIAAEAAGKFPPGFDVAFRTDSAMPP